MGQEQSQLAQGYIADITESEGVVLQPPSFEIPHGDRVITAFGVTGAIRDLFNFCPVDHNEMTQESVNNYVEKLIAIDESEKKEPETEEPEDKEESQLEKTKKKLK